MFKFIKRWREERRQRAAAVAAAQKAEFLQHCADVFSIRGDCGF